MTQVYRSVLCSLDILEHPDISIDEQKEMLCYAQEAARKLYNLVRFCGSAFNRKLVYARECRISKKIKDKKTQEEKTIYCIPSMSGKLPKYPGSIGMWKAMYDTDEYRALNDRVSSYVIRGYDASMRSWFSNLKSNPSARPPGYAEVAPPLTFEVGRNARIYDDGVVRLSVLPGSVDKRFIYCKIHVPPQTCLERIASIKILADGRCALSYHLDTKENAATGIAAIDLGIKRMVTLVFDNGESIMYSGSLYLSVERYTAKKNARCKKSGYKGKGDGESRGKSKEQKRLGDTRNRITKAILHNMTASIIDECKKRGIGTIVIGDLKGIRKDKDFGKKQNQQLHAWPFAKICGIIEYKAEEQGIGVVKIGERNTSRTCSICGNISASSRKGRSYKCKVCGNELHADVNGALNIMKKYLMEMGIMSSVSWYDVQKRVDPVFVAKFDGAYSVSLMPTGSKPVCFAIDDDDTSISRNNILE